MTKKMPVAVKEHFKSKPASKSGGHVPAALAKYHKAHPSSKSAPKRK